MSIADYAPHTIKTESINKRYISTYQTNNVNFTPLDVITGNKQHSKEVHHTACN